ncbi:MAG: regulatory protein RecX [Candidatus Bipolaricaulota bacterium]
MPPFRPRAEEAATTTSDAEAALARILRGHPLSERDAKGRLERLGYPRDEVEAALAVARDERWLDDALLARLWVEDRLLHHPLSRRALEAELRSRGVPADIASRALVDLYPPEREPEVALELARARLARPAPDDARRERRTIDYLLRRGFSSRLAVDAVRRAQEAEGG